MDKRVITRGVVESILRKDNSEFVSKTDEKIRMFLGNAIDELSKRIPFVSLENTVLQPVNELLTGAMTDNSRYVYFLGIDDAQLELNSHKKSYFWLDFKARLKFAWENRKSKRAKKRKLKKEKKAAKALEENNIEIQSRNLLDPEKYDLYKFSQDLQEGVSKFLAKSSLTFFDIKENRIRIVGKEDFGANVQVIIYPVIYNDEFFKYYTGAKKGFINVDVASRCDAFAKKYQQVGQNLPKVLKVINALYNNVNNKFPNQPFIESVLCACPNNLFEGESSFNAFIKIVNYLSFINLKEIKSVYNCDLTIFEDKLIKINLFEFRKFLAALEALKV